MKGTIAAVVVTFNRLELLKKVIGGLRNQSRKLDAIIVVNNSSTDGTSEWLEAQKDLTVVVQPNWGSSGGQYTGAKTAFESGYDWIWLMDDDVVSYPDCLENMCKFANEKTIVAPLRYMSDKPYYNDVIDFNMSNPFKSLWKKILSESDLQNEFIYADGITFEGPMMHRNVIEKIGLPEKKFFIYADDTEFMVRALKSGFKNAIVRDARFDRMIPITGQELNSYNWKTYYSIRNIIAIDRMHGKFCIKTVRPFRSFISWLLRAKRFDNVKTCFKGFWDGWFYKSEN